jgi:hypothetical protein
VFWELISPGRIRRFDYAGIWNNATNEKQERKLPLMVTDSKLEFSGKLKPGDCYEEIMIH